MTDVSSVESRIEFGYRDSGVQVNTKAVRTAVHCGTCKYEKLYEQEIKDIKNGDYSSCNHPKAKSKSWDAMTMDKCWKGKW